MSNHLLYNNGTLLYEHPNHNAAVIGYASISDVRDDHISVLINQLPLELVDIIYGYLAIRNIVFLNKSNYALYHNILKKFICNGKYTNYIRDMIRKDNEFVFEYILRENFKKWLGIKKYYYKNNIFANYIYFVLYYCIENHSSKCRTTVSNYLKNVGLDENQHKKNIIRNIKWRNST